MRAALHRVIWFAAALCLTPGVGRAQVSSLPNSPNQPQATTKSPSATAVVRGRVVVSDTGQPVHRAQVRLSSLDGGTSHAVLTEVDGSFEIENVAPGRYNAVASKNPFISSTYGHRRPGDDAATMLNVLANQTIERLDFALRRGGVVRGRVVDEYGDAVSRAQVTSMQWQAPGGQRRLVNARSVTTDDLGEFRLFGLNPGDYFVQATWRSPVVSGSADDGIGYATTYFPSTPNAADAQRVRVGAGTITSDILIVMTSVPTAKISGMAVDSRGQPLSGMVVVASSSAGFSNIVSGAPLRPDGSFLIANVTPGEYVLSAQARTASDETVRTIVSVAGADITAVRLVGSKPVSISGRILVDPGQSLESRTLMIAAVPVRWDQMIGFGWTPPGKVNADFTFAMKSAPGLRRLEVSLPPEWSVRAIRYRGADITDSGVEIPPNHDVDGIDVEVTSRVTTVSGLVTDARGLPATDYTTVIFPQDQNLWTTPHRYLKTARPGRDGRFTIIGLPPGDYYAAAYDHVDPGTAADPDFLNAIRADATGFVITEGETKALELRLLTSGS
jgi:hypothetical protein